MTLSVSQLAFKKKDEKLRSLPFFEPFNISASKFGDYETRFSRREDEITFLKLTPSTNANLSGIYL